METQDGQSAAHVIEQLLSDAKSFNFFQLIALVNKVYPDAAPIGQMGPFRQEPVRFRANASLAFPVSDVEALTQPEPQAHESMPSLLCTVNFLGLYGPASPIPSFYTEDILTKYEEENNARHFLDIFHHRFISYFYRSWEKYRYETYYQPGGTDEFSRYLFSLCGLGTKDITKNQDLKWDRLLSLVGLLSMRSRSAHVIAQIISEYFGGIPVHIEEFIKQKMAIDQTQRNALGRVNCELGMDMMLGSQVENISGKFRVHIGPVDFPTYSLLSPGTSEHRALRQLVDMVVTDPLDYDIEVSVVGKGLIPAILGTQQPAKLGYDAWLGLPSEHQYTISQTGR